MEVRCEVHFLEALPTECPMKRRLGGPQTWSENSEEQKISYPEGKLIYIQDWPAFSTDIIKPAQSRLLWKTFSKILSTVWLDWYPVWIRCGKSVGVGLNVGAVNVLANSRAQCTCVENKTKWALRPKEIDTEETEERRKARELLGTEKAEECCSMHTRRRHVITFSKHTRQKRKIRRERKAKQLYT